MESLKCQRCDLKIEPEGDSYKYTKPGRVVPIKLEDYNVLKKAWESGQCPICGLPMSRNQT
jgi:hypothetical protein